MITSSLNEIFQRWPIAQGLKLCAARILKKNKVEIFKNLITEDAKYFTLKNSGFNLKDRGAYISVSKEGTGFSDARLRRFTSDMDVFIQIFIWDEFSAFLAQIENKKQINTIIDCGANIGISSIKFNTVFPNATIIAIEPDEGNFSLLKRNLIANRITHFAKKSGIWSKKAVLYFDHSFRDGKDWAITVTEDPNDGPSVESISINDIVNEYQVDVIDLLKIDIEGSEKQVFLDNNSDLNFLTKTRFIAIELHEEFVKKTAIENILTERGFKLMQSGEYLIGKNIANF